MAPRRQLTDAEKEEKNRKLREKRAQEDPQTKAKRLETTRERARYVHEEKKRKLNPEKDQERRDARAEKERNRLRQETPNRREERQKADSMRKKNHRDQEAKDFNQARLQEQAMRQKILRAKETEEDRRVRQNQDNVRHQLNREKEAGDKRSSRAMADKLRHQMYLIEETAEKAGERRRLNREHTAGHSLTRPTLSSLTSQKSKTTPKKTCSSKTLPVAKEPVPTLPRLLPKDEIDLPNPTKLVPEPSINVPGPGNTIPLPINGPITHYIIVPDQISIHNNTTLTLKGGLNLKSNLVPPTVQNDRMDVTTSASFSLDHSYVLVPPRLPTSLDEIVASSASATSQEVPENDALTAPNESDHNYVIRSSSTPNVTEEESLQLDMAGYRNFINGVATPTDEWIWSFNERNNNLVCSCHVFSYDDVMTVKSVKIVTMNKVALYLNGKPITPPDIKFEFRSKADLANILKDFNYRKICQGIVGDSLADIEVTGKCAGNKEGNLWRSKICMGVADSVGSVLCSKCRLLRNYLKRITNNQKTKRLKNSKEDYKLRLRSTERMLKRTKSKIEALSGTIEGLRKERKKLYWNSFDVKIKLLKPKEQLVVKTMMAKATVNPGRNDRFGAMRYDSEFLKECLRIRKKSSAVYKHLRSEGILPLPSQATLLRMMKRTDLCDSNKLNQSGLQNASAESDLKEQSNVENECPASSNFDESVSPTPEIILPHSEEISVSVKEEIIVEILSVQ